MHACKPALMTAGTSNMRTSVHEYAICTSFAQKHHERKIPHHARKISCIFSTNLSTDLNLTLATAPIGCRTTSVVFTYCLANIPSPLQPSFRLSSLNPYRVLLNHAPGIKIRLLHTRQELFEGVLNETIQVGVLDTLAIRFLTQKNGTYHGKLKITGPVFDQRSIALGACCPISAVCVYEFMCSPV